MLHSFIKLSVLSSLGLAIVGCGHGAGASEPVPATQATTQPVQKTKAQWKQILPAKTFYVMFEAGTERPFANEYHDFKGVGTYVSAATGAPLFRSEDKYDSRTGWPSFTRPIDERAVIVRDDPDGSGRLEVLDASSGGHLGHVFDDGPAPTGKRYCMNSAAMRFVPSEQGK
jgi:peptide-methionine (R)-S-oxide reductase